jgi:predicted acetyltransferase
VAVSIRDVNRSSADRGWVQSVYKDYLDALSQWSMNTGMFPVYGDFGDREPDLLARWFADDSCRPLIILQNGRPAGFALVSRPLQNQRANCDFRMSEFFVIESARRCGVGRLATSLIFNRFAGRWEVNEFLHNGVAVAFWRRVISDYTRGQYREAIANGEVQQSFISTSDTQRQR